MTAAAEPSNVDRPTDALPGTPANFVGATIKLYGGDVLIVSVPPWVIADPYESQLLVVAFRSRFRRTIVLVAWDPRGVPTYYGPITIVQALRVLPYDALSWQRYVYRKTPPRKLPIPTELPPNETDSRPSWSYCVTPDTDRDVELASCEIRAALPTRPG